MEDETPVGNAGLWGGIASAVSSIYQTSVVNLNPKAREANVAIAEANARAAEANAQSGIGGSFDPKWIIGIVVVVAIGIAIAAASKAK